MALIGRIPKDTIKRFRAACAARIEDAQVLAANDRRLASLYFHGYAAEMLLKAAAFRVMEIKVNDPIDASSFRSARDQGKLLGVGEPRNLHDILWWARLLIQLRRSHGRAMATSLANLLVAHASGLDLNWRETLRYCANRPRPSESAAVETSARWLPEQYPLLC